MLKTFRVYQNAIRAKNNAVNEAKEPLGQPIMDLDENSACGYELLGKDDGAENKGA